MKLLYYLFAILIVGAFVLGTTYFISDLQTYTGIAVNTTYNASYTKIGDIMNLSTEATTQLQGGSVDSTFNEALQIASFPVLKMVLNSFGLIQTILNDAITGAGLPLWILPIIETIVSLALLFAIISAFFGRET